MAKKFKYKLEGLLKLRTFKENNLKMELGKINRDIAGVKGEIRELRADIADSYETQESFLRSATKSKMAQFFPNYIEGRKQVIENKESLLYSLEKKYQKKLAELNTAMGETKVISNMKETDFEKFRKQYEKKEQEKIEEMSMMRRLQGDKQW